MARINIEEEETVLSSGFYPSHLRRESLEKAGGKKEGERNECKRQDESIKSVCQFMLFLNDLDKTVQLQKRIQQEEEGWSVNWKAAAATSHLFPLLLLRLAAALSI